MTLPGRSKTIVVEPVREPARRTQPAPKQPAKRPAAPARREPTRT